MASKKDYFPRFFLMLLGLVAMLIMIQGAITFIQQKEAFKLVSRENIESEGKRLAKEIESRIEESAGDCLENKDLQALAERLSDSTRLQDSIEFGLKTRKVPEKHPIADSFFLLVDGRLRFPRLRAGKPYSPLNAVDSSGSEEEKEFAALFRMAEKESNRGNYESAIEILQKCSVMPVSDELESRAMDLLARVYLAANNPTNAVRIWNRLEDQFPDNLNEYHVPYALVAAIEIDALGAGENTDRKDTLIAIYKDLLQGRWLLSEQVVLELKERLEERLDYATPEMDRSPYLDRFKTARLVEAALKESDTANDSEDIHALVIQQGPNPIQLFYAEMKEKGSNRILAMSVDLEWVRGSLLDECRESLNSPFRAVSGFTIQPQEASVKTDISIPFSNVFPFLELRLPDGAIAKSQFSYKLQLVIIGLTTITALALWIIILLMFLRITKARMALKIKSGFLSHVSHELKTPVTLIQLYSETLLEDETLDEADRRYSLQVISRESNHLLNLIENLLHLSSTETAPEKFTLNEGDLGPVIEKTAGVYSEWLHKQGMNLKTRIAPALPPVRFDREKVTRAFLNLVDNARKYGGDAPSIEVGLWAEDGRVILEVKDSGPGIPESERKMIFDQFYRGANAAESRGVGLGLFLANETMKAHNGTITLETEPGKGSAFRLTFPVSQKGVSARAGSGMESEETAC